MNIYQTSSFRKSFNKRVAHNKKLSIQFEERLELFISDQNDPLLRVHKLTGAKKNLSAFSITGDIRVLFYKKGNDYYFVDIGSHNQVY